MKNTIQSIEQSGFTKSFYPAAALNSIDAAKLVCENCGTRGLEAVVLRSPTSPQFVTFAVCPGCEQAGELRELQQAATFGRCDQCGKPKCLSILDKVECLSCGNVKWNADLEAEIRQSRRRA